jgi:hypothetical protein
MKRLAAGWLVLAAVGGCVSPSGAPCTSCGGGTGRTVSGVPGVQGPWGQPVAPYAGMPPPAGTKAAKATSAPSGVVQAAAAGTDFHGGIMPCSGSCSGGACGPVMTLGPNGALGPVGVGGGCPPPGAVAAIGALTGGAAAGLPAGMGAQRTSVRFTAPDGMRISWFGTSLEGRSGYDANSITVKGRYNFAQGAVYRLKLSNIPNQADLVLYPTLEVVPANVKTAVFLAHSSVPVAFTDEDFAQVRSGNYVVKVIYLPDPQYQELATAGPSEIVSTRLEPGADPIAEACRRGSILVVVRMGNIDLEAPNTPGMDMPGPFTPGPLPPAVGSAPAGTPGTPAASAPSSAIRQTAYTAPPAKAKSEGKPRSLFGMLTGDK